MPPFRLTNARVRGISSRSAPSTSNRATTLGPGLNHTVESTLSLYSVHQHNILSHPPKVNRQPVIPPSYTQCRKFLRCRSAMSYAKDLRSSGATVRSPPRSSLLHNLRPAEIRWVDDRPRTRAITGCSSSRTRSRGASLPSVYLRECVLADILKVRRRPVADHGFHGRLC